MAVGKYTTRSPGRSRSSGTRGSRAHCSWLVRGIARPAWAQACEVRPEQSNASGPSAPHSYGLPTCAAAYARAEPPAAVGVRAAVEAGAPSAPDDRSSRCAEAVSRASRASTCVSWSGVRAASIRSTSRSLRSASSLSSFLRAAPACCASRAFRAAVARVSACCSPRVRRARTPAWRAPSRAARRRWSCAARRSPVSSIRAYGDRPRTPWYCSRAIRPAAARSASRAARARPSSVPRRRSSSWRALRAASAAL